LFGGHYVALTYGGLTPFELMRGFVLSLTLFGAFGYAETPNYDTTVYLHPTRAVIRQSQSPESPTPPAGQNIAVRDVIVVDVEHGSLSPNLTVLIRGNEIVSVSHAGKASLTAGTEEIDGRGKFLLPGFWDMHTHIKNADVDMPLYIGNGVLGLRNMGGV
jgi:hypothetical protein